MMDVQPLRAAWQKNMVPTLYYNYTVANRKCQPNQTTLPLQKLNSLSIDASGTSHRTCITELAKQYQELLRIGCLQCANIADHSSSLRLLKEKK